jgi:cation diffusion facilitator CzcD-associated flavoprotein CzcO
MTPRARDLEVVIVGAGVGGIAAAIELRRHGIGKVTILERAPDLGGTWFYNRYPGVACDVPSHLYSFSYAQRRDWSRLCSPGEEILGYVHEVARRHAVDRLVVPGTDVTACRWDETERRWTVSSADGRSWSADAVILATGQLHQPAQPRIEGAETFAGHSFHSARWDHDYDLRGKRVAVIGTGASAVQFVPEIAPMVAQLHVFQRTGNWFLPRKNRPYPWLVRAAVMRVPGLQRFRRRFIYGYTESLTLMIRHPRSVGHIGHLRSALFMRGQLRDPAVRRKAWPDYTFGCKRILFSSQFLPALQRPNVELVTDAITGMTEQGIVTPDGTLREVDCVIYATGFRTTDFMLPMEVTGAGGRTIAETWRDGPSAHLGMTVPGFPSLFVMYGPNTNTSGGSIIVYEEAQAAYIRQALQRVRAAGAAAIDVRPEVASASDRELQGRFAGTAWTACDSWYRDSSGRIVTNWPGYMREYEQRVRELQPDEFTLVPLPERVPVPA